MPLFVAASFTGAELAAGFGPVEEVVGEFGEEVFVCGLASCAGDIGFFGVRGAVSGRVSPVLFADNFGHAVAVGVEVCGAWGKVNRVVRRGGGVRGSFIDFRKVVVGFGCLHFGGFLARLGSR